MNQQLLSLSIIPLAGLCCAAFIHTVKPALIVAVQSSTASKFEYCRLNAYGMRSCSFATLEQCQAMSSGRPGSDCFRDPSLRNPAKVYAYAFGRQWHQAKSTATKGQR
jgi:hypothetical protein